ncbi:hypothetical protein U8527_13760 [Kordia algicida OT-1]|uniref:Response regulator receiver (CheY-like) modulated diguanylate cyclase/phosphodiesterase (GGDEF & EAL domains) with n=1 Tax=Kordia algicida OT-1 TaxID=391587 RepID=A9DX71_9FLAO|nr:hypothetical protein [Kordia algicida]EDP95968.1 response regulator receiver (CheY-like) modulated diguanylate cyclase/phosphodiesterase (GGDEF & EAL domains) with [Kordia algicida OT-1]
MLNVDEHITIPSNVSHQDDLDFQYLRDAGQQYIEQLSRKIWTDYNITDPGITIMELLCYAITDLGLRMDQPMENLVASPEKNFEKMHEQFKSAKNILTCRPVTAIDYRKLFIDIKGVKNCWLAIHALPLHAECNIEHPKVSFQPFVNSPYRTETFNIKGLYTILVDFDDDEDYVEEDIIAEIFTKYHENRNLCEDLVEVIKIKKQCIRVCAEVQLENGANEEKVHATIQWAVSQYLSPSVRANSLTEMLDLGLTSDEIFEGPILENGFLTSEALQKSELRKQVRLSDIMNIIMKIEGVKLIEDISIDNCPPKNDDDCDCNQNINAKSDPWLICIEENHLPVLCDQSTFKYKKGFLPVGLNKEMVAQYTEALEAADKASQEKTFDDLPMPLGVYSQIKYNTIQHHLPENYGISKYGLSSTVSDERKVKAKQLQGYLLFFDQVLSTYFSHLEHIKTLLSADENLQQTYFFKAVDGISGIETLIDDYPNYKDNVENIIDKLEDFNERRNELLDHLIARFAEVFEDYTNTMYKLFGKDKDGVEANIINTKNKFIKEYDKISSDRGLAFNYRKPKQWNTNNVSGFQKRIALLSGLDDYSRRDLFNDAISIETLKRETVSEGVHFEYRWKIQSDSKVFLSSQKDFRSKQQAINELLEVLKLATNQEHFVLRQTETKSKRYYVALLNDEGVLVGRQYNHYYATKDKAELARKKAIEYINNLLFDEGFYMIENILTLPYHTQNIDDLNDCLPLCIDDGCNTCIKIDPFSYQVTIIFPGYTSRFSNIDFRIFMEDLIRRELPAHIQPRICWVGHIDGALTRIEKEEIVNVGISDMVISEPVDAVSIKEKEITESEEDKVVNEKNDSIKYTIIDDDEAYDMKHIQKAWRKFLESKKSKANGYMATHKITKELLCAINRMNTIYATGTLHDCNDDDGENKNRIILNRSALGSL